MEIHPIYYYYVFDNDLSKDRFVLSSFFEDSRLLELGFFPHSFEHLVYGCQYYEDLILSPLHSGYCVNFLTCDDNIDYKKLNNGFVKVFFVYSNKIETFIDKLNEFQIPNYVCLNNSATNICKDNVYISKKDVIQYLKNEALKIVQMDSSKNVFFLCEWDTQIKNDYSFNATYINTFISHNIMGNFEFEKQLSYNNCEDTDQKHFIEQIKLIEFFESYALNIIETDFENAIKKNDFIFDKWLNLNSDFLIAQLLNQNIDCPSICEFVKRNLKKIFQSPLVISIPFTTNYEFIQHKTASNLENKRIENVIKFKTTLDYQVGGKYANHTPKLGHYFWKRSIYNDLIGLINASYRFSPYIRLPFTRNEEKNNILSHSNYDNNNDVNSVIEGHLSIETDNIISATELKPFLQDCPRQIVALTDFPFEWIPIDGVPICFTNDICRIMEMPYSDTIPQTINYANQHYIIPQNILQQTLVVFGTEEDNFKKWQDYVTNNFTVNAKVCHNKSEFYDTLKINSPQLLIIDSHGRENGDTTEIKMGDESLTPSDILDNVKNIPLVYLSCCILNPMNKNLNTISNAFIQAGSLSVTSSLLPLNIEESSIVYIRLLNMLVHIKEMPYFGNWLELVSHINRTSYCDSILGRKLSPYLFESLKKETEQQDARKKIKENADEYRNYAKELLLFENRRRIFKETQAQYNKRVDKTKDELFPHFLRTINIGRGDLILFDSVDEDELDEI